MLCVRVFLWFKLPGATSRDHGSFIERGGGGGGLFPFLYPWEITAAFAGFCYKFAGCCCQNLLWENSDSLQHIYTSVSAG